MLALYVLLAAIAAVEVGRDLASPGDYTLFVEFGRAALSGRIPRDPAALPARVLAPYATWPPAFAPIAAVLAAADGAAHRPAVLLFQLLNLAALGGVLAVLARWLYDRRLSLGVSAAAGPGEIPLAAVPVLGALLVPFRLVLSNFEHAQSNLLILALALGGMWLLHRRRRLAGGLALGLATAFKATPLLLLPYLAWRGRWRDLGAAAGGCVVTWLLLPAALLGPGTTAGWYAAWTHRSAAAVEATASLNQSLLALLRRLFPGIPGWPLFLAVAAVLGVVALAAFGRPGRGVDRRREAVEVAVVLAGMSVLSPLSWKAHYVTLVPLCAALLALTPAGRRWRGAGDTGAASPRLDRGIYVALGVAFLAIDVPSHGLVGRAAAVALEEAGIVTLAALLLLGTALVALAAERRGSPRRHVLSRPS